MLKSLSCRRTVFGLLLAAALLGATSGAYAASAFSTPIEELNARFLQVMKAGKTMQFQQRYAVFGPTIAHAFDTISPAERDRSALGSVDAGAACGLDRRLPAVCRFLMCGLF